MPVDLAFVARGVFWAVVAGGTAFLAFACYLLIRANNGGLGYDTQAYWLAGRHLLDGQPLYAQATVSTYGAFKYPPFFAQLFTPLALLPDVLVSWGWRLSGLLCLRYLAGTWKATLFWCAFPPVIRELSMGNVTLQLGAIVLAALRGRRAAALVPFAAALKFGPVLAVPYLWLARREARSWLVAGVVGLGAVCAVSYLVAPSLWSDYAGTFGWETASEMNGAMVLALVPASGGVDFAIRFALAALVALFAAATRRAWLAYAAAVVTVPILDIGRFASLVGLWRLRPDRSPVVEPAAETPAASLAPEGTAP